MRQFNRTISLGLVALLAFSPVAQAADPKPFPDFTFKRVKVPTAGSGPRINVQITPEAEVSSTESTVTASASGASVPPAYDWFWAEISPTLAASGPGRLDEALRHMQNGPAVATPRVQELRNIIEQHNTDILLATIGTRVSPALVLSVIAIESGGNSAAVSSAGATGLMQLMPDTASRFGVEDLTDAKQSINGGVAYLDWLMEEFDSDPVLVLATYNSGEGSVRRYEGVPPFAETRGYVPKVLAAWSVARNLCQTPPELISDGCAFALQGS